MGDSSNIYLLLSKFSDLSILLPVVCSLIFYRYLNRALMPIFYWAISTLILSIILLVLASNGIHNLFLGHIHSVIEFTLFSLFFCRVPHRVLSYRHFVILNLLFLAFAIFDYLRLDNPILLNSATRIIEALVLLVLAIKYLIAFKKEASLVQGHHNPFFWLCCGFLVYYSSTLILFPVFNILQLEASSELPKAWAAHSVMNVLLNLVISISFWTAWKTRLSHQLR